MPRIPKDARDFVDLMEDPLNKIRFGTIEGKTFYAGHVESNGSINIIFANEYVLKNFTEIGKMSVNVDATFRVVPNQFYQLLIIMAAWKGRVIEILL